MLCLAKRQPGLAGELVLEKAMKPVRWELLLEHLVKQ